jgi:hypothetical protein
MNNPISIAIAIMIMFAIVPKPGFCFNGIQNNKTKVDIRKVAAPILSGVFNAIPSARTVQGEFPKLVIIKNASPIPKMVKPNISIDNRCKCTLPTPIDQVDSARQGVIGIVFDGFKKANGFERLFFMFSEFFTAKLYWNLN